MKSYNQFFKFLFALIGCITIFLYVFLKTIKNTIGTLEINQLIWSLKLNNEGVDVSVIVLYVSRLALAIFVCFIFCLIIYRHKQIYNFFLGNYLKKIPLYNVIAFKLSKFNTLFSLLILAILTNFGIHTFIRVDESSDLVYYFQNNFLKSYPKYDFIKENFFVPKIDKITFNNKKNIVIILAESFENTYFNQQNPYHIESKINLDDSISFTNFKPCSNVNFTIATITAWHFGLPLKLPLKDGNNYVGNSFLPNAISVFEVLKTKGYSNYLLLGSNKSYSGQDNLFSQHGNFTIKDKNYWIKNGYSLERYKGSGWGFNDIFILQKGIQQYKELLQKNTPFAMVIETIDLHFPKGWAPAKYNKYQDLRDPIQYVDEQIATFVHQFKTINDPNTVLMVLGDHNFMGSSKVLESKIERTVFNAIYNSNKIAPLSKHTEKVTALDIAPTILDLCGAEWGSKQFGLGISLFSKEKSLIEKYGEKSLNEKISQNSKFYDHLF